MKRKSSPAFNSEWILRARNHRQSLRKKRAKKESMIITILMLITGVIFLILLFYGGHTWYGFLGSVGIWAILTLFLLLVAIEAIDKFI